jgi:quinolinate synthase
MQTLIEKIQELKSQKNALIIAHYYQDGDIQDLADYVGDSLGMALYARETNAKLVMVCGVRFMAESIKAMNMEKKIILPDLAAGCSLADSCTPKVFEHFKTKHPGAFVMTYVNSSLEVKAMSDVIVTSSNAVDLVKQVPRDRKILFAPDQHLGRFVAKETGRDQDGSMVFFPGNCFIHTSFSSDEMLKIKKNHPAALIVAHPECEQAVLMHADFIGSTSKILNFVQTSEAKEFIVMTEPGIIHQMKKSCPDKTFLEGPDLSGCACNECPHMKLNTLEKLYEALQNEEPVIEIDENLAKQSLVPLDRMVEMSQKIS